MMDHANWLELADIYAAGALDGRELENFEVHLKSGCSLCENHIRQAEETLALLPKSLSMVSAPAYVKDRIMQEIGQVAAVPVAAGARVVVFNWGAALVMACLVTALGANLFLARKKMTEYKSMASALAQPETQMIPLAAMEPTSDANGKVFWNPKTCKGIFLANNLSKLPEGKVYELWAISGTQTIPAGTFTVDDHGCAHFTVAPIPENTKVDKFAVTLEPAGGVLTPTGSMHLAGAV